MDYSEITVNTVFSIIENSLNEILINNKSTREINDIVLKLKEEIFRNKKELNYLLLDRNDVFLQESNFLLFNFKNKLSNLIQALLIFNIKQTQKTIKSLCIRILEYYVSYINVNFNSYIKDIDNIIENLRDDCLKENILSDKDLTDNNIIKYVLFLVSLKDENFSSLSIIDKNECGKLENILKSINKSDFFIEQLSKYYNESSDLKQQINREYTDSPQFNLENNKKILDESYVYFDFSKSNESLNQVNLSPKIEKEYNNEIQLKNIRLKKILNKYSTNRKPLDKSPPIRTNCDIENSMKLVIKHRVSVF
uniref:Uncharacterized protein n=1 Tax=viral metagenome TaxID=1070528 RepID=A0A6C0BEX6_9ZZZZ